MIEGEFLGRDDSSAQRFELPASAPLIQRWLVSQDGDGRQQAKPIPIDAFVMSASEFFHQINAGNGIHLTAQELIEFVISSMNQLKQRVRA